MSMDQRERSKREQEARDRLVKDIKSHEEKQGTYRSTDQIVREVQQIQEDVARKKSSNIYK